MEHFFYFFIFSKKNWYILRKLIIIIIHQLIIVLKNIARSIAIHGVEHIFPYTFPHIQITPNRTLTLANVPKSHTQILLRTQRRQNGRYFWAIYKYPIFHFLSYFSSSWFLLGSFLDLPSLRFSYNSLLHLHHVISLSVI